MMDTTPRAIRITEICWEAAAGVACGDSDHVERLVDELISMTPDGLALRLAATGWAALVADYIVSAKGPGSFSAAVDEIDGGTEIFAAVVCAIGNHDAQGAVGLMVNSEPEEFRQAAMQLLGAAGAALASAGGVASGGT